MKYSIGEEVVVVRTGKSYKIIDTSMRGDYRYFLLDNGTNYWEFELTDKKNVV